MKLTIRPLTPDLWAALEDLFGENGAVGGCWCMYRRIGRAIRENPLGRIDDGIKISAALKEVRFAMDSPPEEAGFELPVPPERKAALDRVRRPSVTRRQVRHGTALKADGNRRR